MRTSPVLFCALAAALASAGLVSAQAANGLYYDPSNAASPTGKTIGYELYRTIGCPGRELLGIPCPFDSDAAVGIKAATPVPVAVAPAPVARPVPPADVVAVAPVLVVVPAPAPTAQYCSILDIQFEINKDDIQREDREKLGVVGTFMNRYPDTTAVIEGHTDNVGTAESNLQLSRRRAESVVNYLVGDLRIDPSRLTAVGFGESRPVADNLTEEGKRSNRRIDAVIACATDIEGLNVAPARMTMALMIEYDINQTDIKPQYDGDLRKVAAFLQANPTVTATVEGHTGNLQASPEQAMEISRQRARNVVTYLVHNFAIDPARLSAEGFGQSRRFAYNTSQEGRQENRRVNIIINYAR